MREVRVNAALVKERKERVVNADGGHTGETTVGGKDRIQAD